MFKIKKEKELVILEYITDSPISWIINDLNLINEVTISRIFTFKKEDIFYDGMEADDFDDLESDFGSIEFVLATLAGEYFKIDKDKLNIDFDVYFSKDIEIKPDFFKAERNISIFRKINKVLHEDMYISNDSEKDLPINEFTKLINEFPNSYELSKYTESRIVAIIEDYFSNIDDAKNNFEKYLNKKTSKKGINLLKTFKEYEINKYQFLLNKLESMLDDEVSYSEKQWQKEINQIILLLYPKYMFVFDEAPVKDSIKNTTRSIDHLLVDTNGHIDIIEIKKPFENSIVSKRTYRDNYIPLKELSGTIMQIEKYIYHLNKWGQAGEKKLTEKYSDQLPDNFMISISNPSGIVIMGRDKNLSDLQIMDFELIKRKYNNIIDILTYDDLLRRMRFLIEKFEKQVES